MSEKTDKRFELDFDDIVPKTEVYDDGESLFVCGSDETEVSEEVKYQRSLKNLIKFADKGFIWIPVTIRDEDGNVTAYETKEIADTTAQEFVDWLIATWPTMKEYENHLDLFQTRAEKILLFETLVQSFSLIRKCWKSIGASRTDY